MERRSNYDIQQEQWEQRFLHMDHEALARLLPELELREDSLRLRHFGRLLSVSRRDGRITCLSDARPLSFNACMNVYTLLHYCKPTARLSGEWVSFEDLRDASPFAAAFRRGILLPLGALFSGREALLEPAVRALGGERVSRNGYWLPAFACIPVRLNFWDGDEDFPAQANLLFDRSAVDFIHVESVVTIASEAVSLLATAAGLEQDRRAF